MARRDDNLLSDLLAIFAKLPWWAGVLAAAITYPLLHHYANQPPPVVHSLQQMTQAILPNLLRSVAIVGQYVLPVVFLGGAALSFVGRLQRKRLADRVAQTTQADPLKDLSWADFERLVGEAFRRRGYRVTETAPGPDGGVDLVLKKDGETYLVQCKHWRATKVGVPVVRELFGVMADRGAAGAFVVTSGRFTREASAFAKGRNIELLNGKRLLSLLDEGRTQPKSASASATRQPKQTKSSIAPGCPNCGSPMVERIAKRGKKAGQKFWGCSRYPACKGIRPIV